MINIHALTFQYGRQPLFSDLSLSLERGNIYGLLGLNGAGKTTLLKLITGQIFPHAGTIEIFGYTPALRQADFLSEVSFVPEEFSVPAMSALRYTAINAPFYPKFSEEQMKRYCDELQIDTGKKLTEMSYGQKKKFILAFSLASNTQLVILDEPTNGLDIPSKSQFRRTVSSAMSDERSIIISTHQVRDMEHLIDPLVIIHDQKIAMKAYIEEMEDKLSLQRSSTLPVTPQPLYSESTGLGYRNLYRKEDVSQSEGLDIEFLFNAVISNPGQFSFIGGTV